MKHKSKKCKYLTTFGSTALLEAKDSHAKQRENRAMALQNELAAEYRRVRRLPEDVDIPAADRALLAAASSAQFEVETTTARFAAGRAQQKALERLGNARSELRRCLRSLGLIASDSEAGMNGDSAPPPNATDEQKRAWSREYVQHALTQAATK